MGKKRKMKAERFASVAISLPHVRNIPISLRGKPVFFTEPKQGNDLYKF